MRVRGAGGLLVGIVLMPITDTFEAVATGRDAVDAWRAMLWFPEGFSPGPGMIVAALARDLLVLGGLVVGIAALAGVRAARVPVGLCGIGIALGALPWVIWDFSPMTFENAPPEWVFDHQLWFVSVRWSALIVCVAAIAVAAMALTDRAGAPAFGPAPGTMGGPSFGPAPGAMGGPWPAPAGPGGPGGPPWGQPPAGTPGPGAPPGPPLPGSGPPPPGAGTPPPATRP